MTRRCYFDYNATTPLDPEVREAMRPGEAETFGNPSSLHAFGQAARRAIGEAREQVAAALGCAARELVFTSGGTESINLALKGAVERAAEAAAERRPHVVAARVEHEAVLQSLAALVRRGRAEVTWLEVDGAGRIDPEAVRAALRPATVLITLMMANNEVGNRYPVEAVGALARERGIVFHTDAVQAAGKEPIDLSRLPVDLLSLSAHKFYGPKGVGVLFVREGVRLVRQLDGGAQEKERRAGTENVAGIVGCGVALAKAVRLMTGERERLRRWQARIETTLAERIDGLVWHGDRSRRLANTVSFSVPGLRGDALLIALDQAGIAVSSGSACASGAVEPSHVLLAMGCSPEAARGQLRLSLGRFTTEAEVDYLLETLPQLVRKIR